MWKHRVSKREAATIVQAQIPVLVLHGRHDILAMPCFGEQLAHRSAHCPDRSRECAFLLLCAAGISPGLPAGPGSVAQKVVSQSQHES